MKREIGSSFYELLPSDKEFRALADHKISPEYEYALYYSGRSAFYALLEHIHQQQEVNNIWLPEYYCRNVTGFMERNYETIRYYYIDPFVCDQDFDFSEFAKAGDVVVLNNFWGLFTYSYDPNRSDRPVIIEDHSHGWLTEQCLNSKADYCIASVRKSYPIPGGGVAWIPSKDKRFELYQPDADQTAINARETLFDSISRKRKFLEQGIGDKKTYLELLGSGEAFITKSNSFVKTDETLTGFLNEFIFLDPNPVKRSNLNVIRPLLNKSENFKIVEREGFTPFGLLLLFKDEDKFWDFKGYCIKNDVYPANLWPDNNLKTSWKHFFNIHMDFRYDSKDMIYLADIINQWIKSNG